MAFLTFLGCGAPQFRTEPLLPGLALDRHARLVQLDGETTLDRGILEYVAVAGGGKEYESLFRVRCRPSHLQMAMLMAGYEAGPLPAALRGDFAGPIDPAHDPWPAGTPPVPTPPDGYHDAFGTEPSRVQLDVEVQRADGTWQREPVEHFLIDRRTGTRPERLTWAFTGSFFRREPNTGVEYYVADQEKSVIALWYDPSAMLNLAADVGNPYRGEMQGLAVNPATLPPKGTAVRLIIRPAPLRH